MKKRIVAGAVALGAILAAGGFTAVQAISTHPVHDYTVAQVAAGLSQHPRAWIGRTVEVQGVAVIVDWGNTPGNGGANFCPVPMRCDMPYPPKTTVRLFLLDRPLRGGPADYSLLMTLQVVEGHLEELGERFPFLPPKAACSPVPSTTPLCIVVVKVVPRPAQTILADVLGHVPLVGEFVTRPSTIQGGIYRTYRIHVMGGGLRLDG
jgi:hypothetical protein